MKRIGTFVIAFFGAYLSVLAPNAASDRDKSYEMLRSMIDGNPSDALELLNSGGFEQIVDRDGLDVANRIAIEILPYSARDTWPIEQLQRRRVRALLAAGRNKEALSAAKALFLVSGIGSTPYCIRQLCDCIQAADPAGQRAVNLFKLQQLALAHSDPEIRKKQSAGLGENVLAAIPIDPKPFAQAIDNLKQTDTYDAHYARGNLLLLSGRVPEARAAFERAYALAPPGELRYASEGLAKVIKAEDLSIGRMNQFILSLRPVE